MSECPYCHREVEYVVGVHYDTGNIMVLECECPICGETWDEGRPEDRSQREDEA